MMMTTLVESSVLTTVAYDELREQLRLEFQSRAIYEYAGVPAAVHEGLLRATSKGSYFNRWIRGRFADCRWADEFVATEGAPK